MRRIPIGFGVLCLCAVAIQLGMARLLLPSFALLFRDLQGELPVLTRVALSPWWTAGWIAWVVAGLGLSVFRPQPARGLFRAGILGTILVGWIVTLFAMYLPIFSIAGQIRAE